jgi:hypothetical protein
MYGLKAYLRFFRRKESQNMNVHSRNLVKGTKRDQQRILEELLELTRPAILVQGKTLSAESNFTFDRTLLVRFFGIRPEFACHLQIPLLHLHITQPYPAISLTTVDPHEQKPVQCDLP